MKKIEGGFIKGEFYSRSWDTVETWMLDELVNLYCRIWKEPPWNENFWEPSDVVKQIYQEMKKPNAEIIIMLYKRGLGYSEYENKHNLSDFPKTPSDRERSSVVGFSWGYEVNLTDLEIISSGSSFEEILAKDEAAFYIDELGVSTNFRRYGVGEEMNNDLMRLAGKAGLHNVMLRTDEKAIAARNLYQKLGFKEIPVRDGEYPTRTYWLKTL